MGLFSWFTKRKPKPEPAVPLPQLCYDVAYFILPHYAHNDPAKVAELCLTTPTAAGPFFYTMACLGRKVEPVPEDGRRFRWHHGRLTEGHEYFALEYPTPPPVDLSDVPLDQLVNRPVVLAPHFSVIVRGAGGEGSYFVLGQAPMGGGTTLREVSPGINANLGPGPEPTLTAFLDAARERLAARGRPPG
jgi:hypothetical protein